MGIDDMLPEDAGSSSKSKGKKTGGRSGKSKSVTEEYEYVEIGNEPNKKMFRKKEWPQIKAKMEELTKYSVEEAKSLPSDKRFEVFHQVGLSSFTGMDRVDEEHKPNKYCSLCGKKGDELVEINEKLYHKDHTLGELTNNERNKEDRRNEQG